MTGLTAVGEGFVALAALGLLAWGLSSAIQLHRDRRHGRLVDVDDRNSAERMVSERYRLVGRPDEIRRRPDGRSIPIEWKSRPVPAGGALRSHRTQVLAYCLLLEETTGLSPPYGVLHYADGVEEIVEWNARAREEILRLRRAVARPYDGRADPSPAKCSRCRYRSGCDVRADLYPGRSRAT